MARNKKYREAEERIEEARRSGAKRLYLSTTLLDLDADGLIELLESLGQLTQLQVLDLSQNQLTSVPESLSQLTQLRSLDLSENQLTSVPESLGQLTQLQSLYLPKTN